MHRHPNEESIEGEGIDRAQVDNAKDLHIPPVAEEHGVEQGK